MADPVYPLQIAVGTAPVRVNLTLAQCPRGLQFWLDDDNTAKVYFGGPTVTTLTGARIPQSGGYFMTVERFEHASAAIYLVADSPGVCFVDPQ